MFLSYCWSNSKEACSVTTTATKTSLGYGDPRVLKRHLEKNGCKSWLDIEQMGKVSRLKRVYAFIFCLYGKFDMVCKFTWNTWNQFAVSESNVFWVIFSSMYFLASFVCSIYSYFLMLVYKNVFSCFLQINKRQFNVYFKYM